VFRRRCQPINRERSGLRKLAELKDAGILTEEEFQAKKQQVLAEGKF